jgi:hypothetical protein
LENGEACLGCFRRANSVEGRRELPIVPPKPTRHHNKFIKTQIIYSISIQSMSGSKEEAKQFIESIVSENQVRGMMAD